MTCQPISMFVVRCFLAAFLFCCTVVRADWPSWRGASDVGSVSEGSFPGELDVQKALWKAPLTGKGCSTPIIHDRVIYLTAPMGGKDALHAIDSAGKSRWSTTFGNENPGRHRNGSGSNASPVSDGRAVYVYFKSGTLAAVEMDGSVRWKTNLVDRFGEAKLYWDHGTSPVLGEKYVYMARMHEGDSWLAAFDKASGKMAWKVARNYTTPQECDHGYTTPLVIQRDGVETVLLWGSEHMTMHESETGKVVWSCGGFNPQKTAMWPAIATPVIVDDIAVICYGRNDRGDPRLFGIRLDGSGDVTKTNHLWQRDDAGSFVPTPVAYGGHVYLVGDRGNIHCVDPKTGKSVWKDSFPRSRNKFYSSPLIAGGKLFAPREDGVVFVAEVSNDRFQLLGQYDMGQSVIGSPIPESNRILIRGEKELLCFALSEGEN